MKKTHEEYWIDRMSILENAQTKKNTEYFQELDRLYQKAINDTTKDIDLWYARFASNNGITLAEAQKQLNAKDLKELKWTVDDYIKYGQENAVNGQWIKELENASARYHISRLEAIKLQMQNHVEVLMSKEASGVSSLLQKHFEEGYYKTAFNLQKETGLGYTFSKLDTHSTEMILSKPWAPDGVNFSDRIWKNHKTDLVNALHNNLTVAISRGENPNTTAKSFTQYVNDEVSKSYKSKLSRAQNLVATETAFFRAEGQRQCYKELGVSEYENVACLDSRTSEKCRAMDSTHFTMKDFKPGVTAPPFHNRCRTCTAPWFDDEFTIDGTRLAKDDDGTYYSISENMTYSEWNSKYVKSISDDEYFKTNGVHYVDFYTQDKKLTYKEQDILDKQSFYATYQTRLQTDMTALEQEIYSGLWKDDVTVKDYEKFLVDKNGQSRIQLKREYFEDQYKKTGQIKFKVYLDELSEFEKNGKKYLSLTSDLKSAKTVADTLPKQLTDVRKELMDLHGIDPKKVTSKLKEYKDKLAALQKPTTSGKALNNYYSKKSRYNAKVKEYQKIVDRYGLAGTSTSVDTRFVDEVYTAARKKAAKNFTDKYTADKYYRPKLDNVWDNLSDKEKYSVWEYTRNSNPMNRPLSGYQERWDRSCFKGLGQVDWGNEDKYYYFNDPTFGKKYGIGGHPAYENAIRDLTKGIEKVALDDDVYLVRGTDIQGLAGLLEGSIISYKDAETFLKKGDIKDLKNIILGESFQNHAFISTGIAQGTGFTDTVMYKIYAPKGTKAIYAEPTSYWGDTIKKQERLYKKGEAYTGVSNEAEIIIQRGTEFRITNIEKKGPQVYVDMEVVGQPGYFKTGSEHTFNNGATSHKTK